MIQEPSPRDPDYGELRYLVGGYMFDVPDEWLRFAITYLPCTTMENLANVSCKIASEFLSYENRGNPLCTTEYFKKELRAIFTSEAVETPNALTDGYRSEAP